MRTMKPAQPAYNRLIETLEPVAYADKIAFESAMKAGKGCDVWPKAGDYTQRTGRELVALTYVAPPQPALTDEQIDAICDRLECWSGYGLGAKFNHRAFARAVLAAANEQLHKSHS
jgi:hypothetical protein